MLLPSVNFPGFCYITPKAAPAKRTDHTIGKIQL